METKQALQVDKKEIKLIDGEFTPTQASDILNAMIDQKINFHKIENLQHWEKDHDNDPKPFIDRIQQLEDEKKALDTYITQIKKSGKNVRIDGLLSLSPID